MSTPAWWRSRATATRCRASWPGRWSATRLYPARVVVVAADASSPSMRGSATRAIPATTGSTTSRCCRRKPGALRNGAPFADLPEPLQRLRSALLREPGGDRSWPRCWPLCRAPGWTPCSWRWSSRWRVRLRRARQRGARAQRAGTAERAPRAGQTSRRCCRCDAADRRYRRATTRLRDMTRRSTMTR